MGGFTECFPVFCKEEGDRAQGVVNTLPRHGIVTSGMLIPLGDFLDSSSFQEATDEFFDDINLKQCIDDLHAAVVEAKLRKQKGEVRPDIRKEDLHPRAATRAGTVLLLEKERECLLAELQGAFLFILLSTIAQFLSQVEYENLKLQDEIASNVRQFDENEKKSETLLDTLDEVHMFLFFLYPHSSSTQVIRERMRLPADNMSRWARDMIQQLDSHYLPL